MDLKSAQFTTVGVEHPLKKRAHGPQKNQQVKTNRHIGNGITGSVQIKRPIYVRDPFLSVPILLSTIQSSPKSRFEIEKFMKSRHPLLQYVKLEKGEPIPKNLLTANHWVGGVITGIESPSERPPPYIKWELNGIIGSPLQVFSVFLFDTSAQLAEASVFEVGSVVDILCPRVADSDSKNVSFLVHSAEQILYVGRSAYKYRSSNKKSAFLNTATEIRDPGSCCRRLTKDVCKCKKTVLDLPQNRIETSEALLPRDEDIWNLQNCSTNKSQCSPISSLNFRTTTTCVTNMSCERSLGSTSDAVDGEQLRGQRCLPKSLSSMELIKLKFENRNTVKNMIERSPGKDSTTGFDLVSKSCQPVSDGTSLKEDPRISRCESWFVYCRRCKFFGVEQQSICKAQKHRVAFVEPPCSKVYDKWLGLIKIKQ